MSKLLRKFMVIIMSVLLIVAFAGCGNQSDSTGDTQDSQDAQTAGQTDFPTKPIQLLCVHKAGASTDIIARTLQSYLSDEFGQQVVVQNVTGGGGLEAMSQLNKADPDGYTLLITPFPSGILKQVIGSDVDFDLKNFTFVMGVSANDNNAVAVPVDSPIKTIDDFMKASNLKISGSGVGTNGHLASALLKDKAGVSLTYIPFEGGPEAINAVLGKQVDATVANIVGAVPLAESGQLRLVGVFGTARDSRFPDVPTFAESGYPAVAFDVEVGIVGPPNMPEDVLKVLRDGISKVVNNPEVATVAVKAGFNAVEVPADKLKADVLMQFEQVEAEKAVLTGK